jgi:hypothetical protein
MLFVFGGNSKDSEVPNGDSGRRIGILFPQIWCLNVVMPHRETARRPISGESEDPERAVRSTNAWWEIHGCYKCSVFLLD